MLRLMANGGASELGHADRAVFGMWMRIDDQLMATTVGSALVDQLRMEISPDHELTGKEVNPAYMCIRCDDVIFRVSDDQYARVHLMWAAGNQDATLPSTTVFDSHDLALAHMAKHGCKRPGEELTRLAGGG